MIPSKGRIVFVVLSSGDVVPAVVRRAHPEPSNMLVDVTAFPDSGPEALRLDGLGYTVTGAPLTWHWPPRT